MTTRFPRRALLRAAGAGILAAPFTGIRSFLRTAHAQSVQPKRLIVYWMPNGAPTDSFWPSGSGSNFTLSPILEPLQRHKTDLTILRGITYSGTGDHKTGKPFSTTGFVPEEAGPSIDQEVAREHGSPPIVVCGQSKGNVRGYISYAPNGSFVTPEKDPRRAYETIFGPLPSTPTPGTEPTTPSGRDAELEDLILETAIADAHDIRARLPAAEQVKMDDQVAALSALKKNLMGDPGGMNPPPAACDHDPSTFGTPPANFRARMRLHADLIATAFACDARRVASFMIGPVGHDNMGGDLSFVQGVSGDLHNNIAHPDYNGQRMREITRVHAEDLAYLIDRLKSIPEGNKTVFDNTVILWTTECTHGNHGHTNIPVVLIGSGGGVLKTNQFIQFSSNPGYQNVLLAVAHAAGRRIGSFGERSSGPLPDLMA